MQVRGRKPGQNTPTKPTGLQLDSSFRGVMTGRKGAMLLSFVFPELQLYQGPTIPRHPPYHVFKNVSDTGKVSQPGEWPIFCTGLSHRKEAILVLQKVKSNFLVPRWKKTRSTFSKHRATQQRLKLQLQRWERGPHWKGHSSACMQWRERRRRPRVRPPPPWNAGFGHFKWQHPRLWFLKNEGTFSPGLKISFDTIMSFFKKQTILGWMWKREEVTWEQKF